MVVGKGRASPRLFVVSGEPQQLPDQSKVRTSDEGPLRMGDEGCPNESPGADDPNRILERTKAEAASMICDEVS